MGHVLHINAAKPRAQREDDLIGLCVRKINKEKKQAAIQPTAARKLSLGSPHSSSFHPHPPFGLESQSQPSDELLITC